MDHTVTSEPFLSGGKFKVLAGGDQEVGKTDIRSGQPLAKARARRGKEDEERLVRRHTPSSGRIPQQNTYSTNAGVPISRMAQYLVCRCPMSSGFTVLRRE